MRLHRRLLRLVGTAVALGAPLAAVGAEEPTMSDLRLDVAVETALAARAGTDTGDIDVQVDRGVVTLSGFVFTMLARETALRVTGSVPGVREVRDMINISPGRVSDGELSLRVREALTRDPALPVRQLTLVVEDGVVTLVGQVECQEQREAALWRVKGVRGVRGLTDLLTVAP